MYRVHKPKNPIWLPDSHFENDVAENRWDSTLIHKFGVDIQSQTEFRVRKQTKIVTRWPYWKVCLWKLIRFFLWPQSICKLDLCYENHVVYRQTDRRTDKLISAYPPLQEPCGLQTDGQTDGQTYGHVDSSIPSPASLGGDINIQSVACMTYMSPSAKYMVCVPGTAKSCFHEAQCCKALHDLQGKNKK